MTEPRCPVCWGSHACGYPRGHEGNHACVEDGEPHDEINREGVDEHGFRWSIYTVYECGRWWPGGNCVRHEEHAGPHHDGTLWFDDDGSEVFRPSDAPQP